MAKRLPPTVITASQRGEACHFGAPGYRQHRDTQGYKRATIGLRTRSDHCAIHRKGWHHPGPVHRSNQRTSKASGGRRVHFTSGPRRRTRGNLASGFERHAFKMGGMFARVPSFPPPTHRRLP
ncbi:hypothetical protein K0M31_016756 [Melipona bicolor]|uniref:Uncharacterized protein n=1 Tax=Melipona bicolor TaxID=60889 RepID=A0AA40FE72_9HYME|nr:hypothetical protein K0M31_016756 [Melipona bicolor]